MIELTEEQLAWERESKVAGPAFEVGGHAPRLMIFGAVPLSAALCRAARAVHWIPHVIDPRARFARPEAFPDAERVVVAWPAEAVAELGGIDEATAVALLTHAAELDDPALIIALRSPAFYVGAMGSRNTQRRRRDRMAAAGLTEDELARLSGPAGLDLGGRTAAETAVAILAEAIAARHGREGGRLTASEHAIHVAGRP
ncbi:MAG: XdhC family protein [Solirubrobacterales bacterium]|nr:XdhC family protein [Solirubrobacterales bacterium]